MVATSSRSRSRYGALAVSAALLVGIALIGVLAARAARAATPTRARPTPRATSRPVRPRGPQLEDFAGGRKPRRATVKSIDEGGITVTFTEPARENPDAPLTQTLKTDAQTRVLISVAAPMPKNLTIEGGGQPARLRYGKLTEVKAGKEVEVAADDDGHALLIMTVFPGDLVIVGMPLPPSTRPTTRATTRLTTGATTGPTTAAAPTGYRALLRWVGNLFGG